MYPTTFILALRDNLCHWNHEDWDQSSNLHHHKWKSDEAIWNQEQMGDVGANRSTELLYSPETLLKLHGFMGIYPSGITRMMLWLGSQPARGVRAHIQICSDVLFLENSRALQDFNTAHSQEDWNAVFCRLRATQTAKLHPLPKMG